MGGHNSTRWNGAVIRLCAESCFTICAPRGALVPGRTLVVRWLREGMTARCEVAEGPALVLRHDWRGGAVQLVRLAATRANLGGSRRWFLCPGCGARVGRLYLPGRGPLRREFKCRACYGLTYESAQSSRTWVRSYWLAVAGAAGLSYREARDVSRASMSGAYLYEARRLDFGRAGA